MNDPSITKVTPWKALWFKSEFYSHVRIWVKQTAFGFFQRHEWKYIDEKEGTYFEQWIPSPVKAFPPGAVDANES